MLILEYVPLLREDKTENDSFTIFFVKKPRHPDMSVLYAARSDAAPFRQIITKNW